MTLRPVAPAVLATGGLHADDQGYKAPVAPRRARDQVGNQNLLERRIES